MAREYPPHTARTRVFSPAIRDPRDSDHEESERRPGRLAPAS